MHRLPVLLVITSIFTSRTVTAAASLVQTCWSVLCHTYYWANQSIPTSTMRLVCTHVLLLANDTLYCLFYAS